jgi:hypothetical protein
MKKPIKKAASQAASGKTPSVNYTPKTIAGGRMIIGITVFFCSLPLDGVVMALVVLFAVGAAL